MDKKYAGLLSKQVSDLLAMVDEHVPAYKAARRAFAEHGEFASPGA